LYLVRQDHHARELDEEMAFHRDLLARRGGEGGARGPVFGDAALAREDARAGWVGRWADGAGQEVRYAVRAMRRQPGFSAAAIAILALGMGATMCVFNLLDALTLRSLPVDRPDRLVYFSKPAFSYPIFTELRARMTVFDGVFGWNI